MDVGSIADWFSGSMSAAAVVVALGGYGLAAKQRQKEEKAAKSAAAEQAYIKLLIIANSISDLNCHLSMHRTDIELSGPGETATFRMVQAMIGFGNEADIQFEASEVRIFMNARQAGIVNDLLLLARRHTVLIHSMKEYAIRRDALASLLPPPKIIRGLVLTHEFTEEEYMRVRPYMLQVENLIKTIVNNCTEDLKLATSVCERFGTAVSDVTGAKNLQFSRAPTNTT